MIYRNILKGKLQICKRENIHILFFISAREAGYTASLVSYYPRIRWMKKCGSLEECVEQLELKLIDIRDRYYEEILINERLVRNRMFPKLIHPASIDDGIN